MKEFCTGSGTVPCLRFAECGRIEDAHGAMYRPPHAFGLAVLGPAWGPSWDILEPSWDQDWNFKPQRARNGVRPVVPRRGLNPAALREAEAGAVLDPTQEPSKVPLLAWQPAEAGLEVDSKLTRSFSKNRQKTLGVYTFPLLKPHLS